MTMRAMWMGFAAAIIIALIAAAGFTLIEGGSAEKQSTSSTRL
jgi:ammonia channel protein AmtB